jgi:hypothetical protein
LAKPSHQLLICRHHGSFISRFIFFFQERKMPSGEESILGLSITFTSVSRHHSGIYICSADNGFDKEPVETQIKLDVHRE